MIKPDVITVSPRSLDYPLWRSLMTRHRDMFREIHHVIYDDHRGVDYSAFAGESLSSRLHAVPVHGGQDWRNVAVNAALNASWSEWVLFLEQDFLPLGCHQTQRDFFEQVFTRGCRVDAVGFRDGSDSRYRYHPAFLLVHRDRILQTSRMFAPSQGMDHFGVFSQELDKQRIYFQSLENLALIEGRDWKHWAGVSHNMHLAMEGKPPCYRPDEFREFIELSLAADVPQHPDFVSLMRRCLSR